jgi:hypothetical protein
LKLGLLATSSFQKFFQRIRRLVYPVQLLKDRKGIYGIGVVDEIKRFNPETPEIVLRPDLLLDDSSPTAALQMLTGGSLRRLFKCCTEEMLRRVIHEEMLWREGFTEDDACPKRPDGTWGNFWAIEAKQERLNRNKYHGLRRASRAVVNRLIARALAEAADPDAIKQARRFSFSRRYKVYRACAISARFLQLTSVFPVLALAILDSPPNWDRLEAQHLVEIGAPLKMIAQLIGVPMALRKVKPVPRTWRSIWPDSSPMRLTSSMPTCLARCRA